MSSGSAVYEIFIFALTIFSLLMLTAYFFLPLSDATRQAIFRSDFVISLVFLADFLRSLIRAPDKKAYMRWGWLDLLGSIPAVLPLRLARLARLARAWRIVRVRDPREALRDFETNRAQGVLLITLFVGVTVLTLASILVLELESGAPGANIDTGDDAFWWAFVTMTTVGYGDHYPVTVSGRVVATVLMTVGVGLFGVLTSFLAATFVISNRVEKADMDLVREEIAAMQAELVALRELLETREAAENAPEGERGKQV